MGYIDFVRGKYPTSSKTEVLQTLKTFVEEMTTEEKQRLLTQPFDSLWEALWSNKTSRSYLNDKSEAKRKFSKLDIQNLVNDTVSSYSTQEYGIPKGRRHNSKESDIECAKREFFEETGISEDSYIVQNRFACVNENFLGSNGVMYSHVYFIAKYQGNYQPVVDPTNQTQIGEVRSVGWFTIKDSFRLFRHYDTAKKNCLLDAWFTITQNLGLSTDINVEFGAPTLR